jgi:hypothetical protein
LKETLKEINLRFPFLTPPGHITLVKDEDVKMREARCSPEAYQFVLGMCDRLNNLLKVRECLAHALEMGHFTPGGSTENWAKEVLEKTRETNDE